MNAQSVNANLQLSETRGSIQLLLGWSAVTVGTLLIVADWLHALS